MKTVERILMGLLNRLPDNLTGSKRDYTKNLYCIYGKRNSDDIVLKMKLKNLKKYGYTIIALSSLLILLLISSLLENASLYSVDEDGRMYIERPTIEEGSKYKQLIMKGKINGEEFSQNINLFIKPKGFNSKQEGNEKSEKSEKSGDSGESKKEKALREIDSIVFGINKGDKDKKVYLPTSIRGIDNISWNAETSAYGIPILFIGIMSFLCIYFSRYDELKKLKRNSNNSITEKLPEFLNKIVLLMNAGLVLRTAFQKAVEDNDNGSRTINSYFYQQLKEIEMRVSETNAAIETELKVFAQRSGNREFMRVTNIISDNINKGTELVDILQRESELLWFQRKKRAEERGKIAETKLTLPLALQLISLIMVTLAPAIINM
ncbi:MAG: type II secretion system F family protein [Aminipila sp.]